MSPHRRQLIAPLAAALALGVAAPAPAKEITGALACGADGCRGITKRMPHDESMLQSGGLATGPGRRARFYRLRFTIGEPNGEEHGSFRLLFLPAQHLTSSTDDATGERVWSSTTTHSQRALERAVRGLRPFPAARMPLPRPGARPTNDALPPEVVAIPARAAAPADDGIWPWVAGLLGAGGIVVLVFSTRLSRGRRRRRTAAPGPTASPSG